ncbi:rhodanese domain protein [Candidatus Rickettsiella viridis]|uniref:Rhodanese domain protein n=1 Tax=Candidatus Rickettsiella viridis TaxID=676208 RepID=A0A2Z5UUE6_9COXI|nr:rhodanese-like domain-containing protein [Candidatus Rickettsiella viridis]BBB14621.1 rhodanese domain protein [Candidatus Rickettsiella viridis]
MQQFIEFSLRHWELWLAFLVILGFLLTFELHIKLTGASPLSVQQAIFLMNREEAILLDIRDANSFSKEHIAASINIPFSELAQKINQLDSYRERPIIINYSQGQAHHRAARLLKNAGFSKIYQLKGGIMSWKNAALPLAKK